MKREREREKENNNSDDNNKYYAIKQVTIKHHLLLKGKKNF